MKTEDSGDHLETVALNKWQGLRRFWDFSNYRIDGDWSVGVELRTRDLHDSCGRWLEFAVEVGHRGFSVGRYLGPTAEDWDDESEESAVSEK